MSKSGFIQRADGLLQTTVKDPKTGKRVYFYGKNVREVKEKILTYNQKQERGISFKEISSGWWEEAEPLLSSQSKRGYKQAKERAEAEFYNTSIKDIKVKDVNNYLRELGSEYTSIKTVQRFRLVLNLIFKYAIEHNEIEYNPCSNAKMPKGLQKSKRSAASVEDEKIIKNTKEGWLFPFFAIYTGMRKGEILALQWKDINFKDNLINVYKSVQHEGNKPSIKDTKTEAGTRIVPLLKPLKERLEGITPRRAENYIFSDDGSQPLTNRRYITLYNEYKKKYGITCTAHQLRHSFATIAFENGIDAKDVQELLGHKQLSTTLDIYTDFRKSHLIKLTDKLNEIE
ncbi:MAG: site-specific integrase [Clostridia bacterium]|nr:site-specific integrase [Clostridia bacterium]